VTRPGDVQHVEVALDDAPIEVHVQQVQAGRGAPVSQEPLLDVLRRERLANQRVVEQVDLADREVVGGPPVGVDLPELNVADRMTRGCRHGPIVALPA
jgi:hypothetical protein